MYFWSRILVVFSARAEAQNTINYSGFVIVDSINHMLQRCKNSGNINVFARVSTQNTVNTILFADSTKKNLNLNTTLLST